jgi:hypothetical protein
MGYFCQKNSIMNASTIRENFVILLYLTESGLRKKRNACAIHRVTQSHPVNKPQIPFLANHFPSGIAQFRLTKTLLPQNDEALILSQ